MLLRIYLFFFLRIKRNYNSIIKKNELHKLRKLKSDLSNFELENIKNKFSTNYEISVRQYLFQKLLGQLFLKQLLFFFNSKIIIFPIPKEWNIVFEKNSFKVNFLSNILFKIFIFSKIIDGIIFIFRVCHEYLNNRKKNIKYFSNYIIIYNLNKRNLNSISTNPNDFNLLFWLNKKYQNHKFFFVNKTHNSLKNKKLNYLDYYFSIFIKDINLKIFILNSFIIILKSFLYLLTNNWSKVLMTEEIIKKTLINSSNINKSNFPKKNIFLYSANIYRPLWTYEAEKFTDIDLLMTSELSDLDLSSDRLSKNYNFRGYNLITWPNIYIWTKKNLLEFKNILPKSNIYTSDPISITDYKLNLDFSERIISIFTYEFVKGYYGISQRIDYLSHKADIKFFNDIIKLAEKYNFNIVIKNKSKNNKYVSKKYKFLMSTLSLKKNIQIIEPNISPHRIIKLSDATISLPVTSTFEIGKYYSKPSIYYDPINLLQDQKSSNLLKSYEELDKWFKELQKNFKQ